ncbi:MAG: universal stress protein [Hyphomicrobiaceae bacterium]
MAMKTVLVPFPISGAVQPVLETAHAFASRFDAYMEGVILEIFASDFMAVDGFGGGWLPPSTKPAEDVTRDCREAFVDFMKTKGVPAVTGSTGHLSYRWCDDKTLFQGSIAEYSRIFDLVVFAAPAGNVPPMQQVALETTLFESGRPILVAPLNAPARVGEQVMVAWNGSTESALTTALAMPVLQQAKRVIVLTVQGGTVPGPTGLDLTRHLIANGIAAEERTVEPGKMSTGEKILAEAVGLSCDLIIKGAYTQSRLRQLIFGGATRHILSHSPVPVFMAH